MCVHVHCTWIVLTANGVEKCTVAKHTYPPTPPPPSPTQVLVLTRTEVHEENDWQQRSSYVIVPYRTDTWVHAQTHS